jgi:hypothetical protein
MCALGGAGLGNSEALSAPSSTLSPVTENIDGFVLKHLHVRGTVDRIALRVDDLTSVPATLRPALPGSASRSPGSPSGSTAWMQGLSGSRRGSIPSRRHDPHPHRRAGPIPVERRRSAGSGDGRQDAA